MLLPERWRGRWWRAPALLLGAAAVLVLSARAARRGATTIVFSQHLAPQEGRAVGELLHRFEVETGIRVERIDLGEKGELPERLEADRRGGPQPIGVFAQDNVKLLPLVQRRLVEDLSDIPVPQVGVALVPLVPDVGKRYFLPFRPNVQITYVSKEALRKTGVGKPRSVDELVKVARAFRDQAGEGKVTLSLADGNPGAVTLAEMIRSFGGDPLALNDQGSAAALRLLRDMWREGLLARESRTAKYDTEPQYLDDQTSWLAQTWPFTSAVLARGRKLASFGVYPGWSAAHVIGGDVLGIPRGLPERERKAARALVVFLMGRDSQRFLANENAWPSIREDAYSGTWWGGCGGSRCPPWVAARQIEHSETLQAARQALRQGGWLRPNSEQWRQVSCAMTSALRRILDRGEDVGGVLDELHRRVTDATACPHASP